MPHDRNGKLLRDGDEVVLKGIIKSIQAFEEYCNAQVMLVPMPPYTDPYVITINTRQTELVEHADVPGSPTLADA